MTDEQILAQLRELIDEASIYRRKSAMMTLGVMLHADELKDMSAHEICRKLGLKPSFYIEIRKCFAMHELMKELGYEIVKSET